MADSQEQDLTDQDPANQGNGEMRFEQSLREALHGVVVPSNLSSKLRERIRMESSPTTELPPAPRSEVGCSAEQSAVPLRGFRALPKRLQLVGLAAAIGLLACGYFIFSPPLSSTQLIEFCLADLNEVLDSGADWNETKRENELLKVVQLSGDLRFAGSDQRPAGQFGDACTVWKFVARNGQSLYVFEFSEARSVEGISSQLKILQRLSGGWSLAAQRTNDHLFVVVTQGDLHNHIKLIPTA